MVSSYRLNETKVTYKYPCHNLELNSTVERPRSLFEELEAGKECQSKRKGKMQEDIQEVLQRIIRPILQADGGDVELVNVQDGVVSIRLKGACFRCPMSTMTLKMVIERVLKEKIPEVKEVLAV